MIDKLLIKKAYVEVIEILKYIPKEDYNKIPKEILQNMKLNMDNDYIYTITHFDNFQEQEMLKETETILAIFFRDYWATEEQRKRILEKENYDIKILEEEKRKIYNPDHIFKKSYKNDIVIETNENDNNITLIENRNNFFKKLKDFICKLLNIDK